MAIVIDEVDDILEHLGLGKWQIGQSALIYIYLISWAYATLGTIILGFVPDFACKPPEKGVGMPMTNSSLNVTFGQSCLWYNASLNTSETCAHGYIYAEPKEASIVSEWDLVCGQTFLTDLAFTMFNIGVSVGTVAFSVLADKYGRRKVSLPCHVAFLLMAMCNALSPSITMFIVTRFFMGIFLPGVAMVVWVTLMEMFVPKHRTLAALLSNIGWGVASCFLPAIGYIMKGISWRYVQVAMASSSLIVVAQYFFLDESVRWLMANGRQKEAMKIIRRAARINGVNSEELTSMYTTTNLPDESGKSRNEPLILPKNIDKSEEGYDDDVSPMKIITHPGLRKITCVLALVWFTNSLTYTGLYLLSSTLSGDRYLNLFLSALMDLAAGVITIPILLKCGRKKVLIGLHLLASLCLISAAALYTTTVRHVSAIFLTGFIMIGKFSITSTFNLAYMYTPEVYPTNIRSFGTGVTNTACRIASIVAPFTATIAREVPWVPAAVFGGFCFFVALTCLLLPETRNKDLPQTLADLDKLCTASGKENRRKGNTK